MKISISYGNSASINTGVAYESIKPFYNISCDLEVEENPHNLERMGSIAKTMIEKAKAEVDTMLFRDMRYMNEIRKKCTCNITYNDQHKPIHEPYCFMSKT